MDESKIDQIEGIWSDDKLNRQRTSELYTSFLNNQYKALKVKHFVLNIDSAWGGGKSFFIERWANTLKVQGHLCVTYDAWSNDYTRDPMLSLLRVVLNGLEEHVEDKGSAAREKLSKTKQLAKKVFLKSAPVAVPAATLALFGFPFPNPFGVETASHVDGVDEGDGNKLLGDLSRVAVDSMLEKDSSRDAVIGEFKHSVRELVETISEHCEVPIYIFIDELDRCRPDFAIDLIECVKHIFDIESVFFVFGTDGRQLQASINSKYGPEFDSEIYFKRIFQREFRLPDPDFYSFSNMLFSEAGLEAVDNELFLIPQEILKIMPEGARTVPYVISMLSEHFNLQLRDIEQCFRCFSAFIVAKNEPTHVCYAFFLVVLWHKNKTLFDDYSRNVSKSAFLRKELIPKIGNIESKFEYGSAGDFGRAPQNKRIVMVSNSYVSYADYHDSTFRDVFKQSSDDGVGIRAQVQRLLEREVGSSIHEGIAEKKLSINTYPIEISQLG